MLHQYSKSLHSYNPIPGGCVLYLSLGNPGLHGTVFKSVDPFGHVCTRTGGTMDGNGFTADGDDNISIPDHAALDITTNLSVFAWVKLPDATPAASMRIIGKYITTGAKREWDSFIDTLGRLSLSFGDPADGSFEGGVLTDAAVVSDNVFELVGFTFNGAVSESNRVRTYKAGSVVADTISGAIPASLWNDTADVRMGESNSGGEDLTGTIGEVWIYNRTLSTTEALYLSDKTKGRWL